MKKIILGFIAVLTLIPYSLKADEGMWFLMFIERLNHRDMQKMGLKLTAEEIYSRRSWMTSGWAFSISSKSTTE